MYTYVYTCIVWDYLIVAISYYADDVQFPLSSERGGVHVGHVIYELLTHKNL